MNELDKVFFNSVEKNQLQHVQNMIDCGFDVNVRNIHMDNRTPLHSAVCNRNIAIVEYLLKHGANINAVDCNNWTSLHFACFDRHGHIAIVECLLKYGADVHSKDNGSSTPLHHAVYSGHIAIVECLLKHGADINAKTIDHFNWTPLHYAVAQGRYAIAKILLGHGAELNVKNSQGKTPLELVIAMKAGLAGFTPLEEAVRCEDQKMIDIFKKYTESKNEPPKKRQRSDQSEKDDFVEKLISEINRKEKIKLNKKIREIRQKMRTI